MMLGVLIALIPLHSFTATFYGHSNSVVRLANSGKRKGNLMSSGVIAIGLKMAATLTNQTKVVMKPCSLVYLSPTAAATSSIVFL